MDLRNRRAQKQPDKYSQLRFDKGAEVTPRRKQAFSRSGSDETGQEGRGLTLHVLYIS